MQSRSVYWLPYFTVILIFLILFTGFNFNGLYGQDAHEYLRYSKALRLFMETGEDPGSFYWPKLFPFLGAIISFSGLSINMSLQLVSLGSILGAIYFAQKSFKLLYDSDGSWFLILGAATQVYFIRSGMVVMSDALTTFSLMGFLFLYLQYLHEQSIKVVLFLLFFSIIAVFSRYAAMPLIAIPLTHVFYLFLMNTRLPYRIVLIVVGIILLFMVLFSNNQVLTLTAKLFESWSILNLFKRNFIYESFPQTYWVPNGLYILSNFAHIGYLSIGTFLMIWWKKWNFKYTFLWLGVVAYLIFIGGIGFQNQRFMVISHLWILVLIFPSFLTLKNWLTHRKLWSTFVITALIFNGAFFYYSFSKTFALHQLEKDIAVEMLKLDRTKTIYTFSITPSLESYNIPNPKIDLWTEDVKFKEGRYVVFNLKEFKQNERVMSNWYRLNDLFMVVPLQNLPEDWRIYQVENIKTSESSSN